jgi:small subunit ribosomal protein S2
LDSNSDPTGITYPIPGNDDAIRAIKMYCELISNTVLGGISDEMKSAGVDVGEGDATPAEALPVSAVAETAAADDDDKKTVVVKKPRSRARTAKKADDAAAPAEG